MTTGRKTLRLNRSERLVSTDFNRAQRFIHTDEAELLRALLDTTTHEDVVNSVYPDVLVSGGTAQEHTTAETPLRAEIIGGLLVRPQLASWNILVDAGVGLFIAPDGTLDESNLKYVRDPGVALFGALVFTPNVSASKRVDVVECQPVEVIEEVDNRDVELDPDTGAWSAQNVTKVSRLGLTFRVRAGTPGAGYPGNVSGWLPLMVGVHAANSASSNDVDCWDVRPLVADRVKLPDHRRLDVSGTQSSRLFTSYAGADAGKLVPLGCAYAVFQGSVAGGFFGTAQPIDLYDIDHKDPAGTFTTARLPWHLYMCFPFSLPRWVRYQAATANRVPNGPRGVPVLSTIPTDATALSSVPVTIPSGVFGAAIVVPASRSVSVTSGVCGATTANPILCTGGEVNHINGTTTLDSTMQIIPSTYGVAFGAEYGQWDIPDGTYWPANVMAVDFIFRFFWSAAPGAIATGIVTPSIRVAAPNLISTLDLVLYEDSRILSPTAGGSAFLLVKARIPIGNFTNFFPVGGALTRRIQCQADGSSILGAPAFNGTTNKMTMHITGWRLKE